MIFMFQFKIICEAEPLRNFVIPLKKQKRGAGVILSFLICNKLIGQLTFWHQGIASSFLLTMTMNDWSWLRLCENEITFLFTKFWLCEKAYEKKSPKMNGHGIHVFFGILSFHTVWAVSCHCSFIAS